MRLRLHAGKLWVVVLDLHREAFIHPKGAGLAAAVSRWVRRNIPDTSWKVLPIRGLPTLCVDEVGATLLAPYAEKRTATTRDRSAMSYAFSNAHARIITDNRSLSH